MPAALACAIGVRQTVFADIHLQSFGVGDVINVINSVTMTACCVVIVVTVLADIISVCCSHNIAIIMVITAISAACKTI